MLESKKKIENVKVSQSSKCKRTRWMFTLIGTMDPGSWFHLISLSLKQWWLSCYKMIKVHIIVIL